MRFIRKIVSNYILSFIVLSVVSCQLLMVRQQMTMTMNMNLFDIRLHTHRAYCVFRLVYCDIPNPLPKYTLQFKCNLIMDFVFLSSFSNDSQEIFYEHATHLRFLNEQCQSNSLISSATPEHIRTIIVKSYQSCSRHAPYFIYGAAGSGKSSLLANLYMKIDKWFDYVKVYRVIRFAAATPRSAYNLELLRVICQQISIILNIPEGYLPKDASFDPLYINTWFQNLLRRCEEQNGLAVVLFIDDLHKLNPLDCDIVAALSWLPISLPRNVYLICTSAVPIDALRLTQMQKERFKQNDCLFELSNEAYRTQLKKAVPNESFDGYIQRCFDELEASFGGAKGFGRLATYLTCTEYGLTETELLELLMPINNSEALLDTSQGDFNFSTFRCVRNQMSKFCIFFFFSKIVFLASVFCYVLLIINFFILKLQKSESHCQNWSIAGIRYRSSQLCVTIFNAWLGQKCDVWRCGK